MGSHLLDNNATRYRVCALAAVLLGDVHRREPGVIEDLECFLKDPPLSPQNKLARRVGRPTTKPRTGPAG